MILLSPGEGGPPFRVVVMESLPINGDMIIEKDPSVLSILFQFPPSASAFFFPDRVSSS